MHDELQNYYIFLFYDYITLLTVEWIFFCQVK